MRSASLVGGLILALLAGPSWSQTKPTLRFMQNPSYSDDYNGNHFPTIVRDRLGLVFDVRETNDVSYRFGVHMGSWTSETNTVDYWVVLLDNCGAPNGRWCYRGATSGRCRVTTNCEDTIYNWIVRSFQGTQ